MENIQFSSSLILKVTQVDNRLTVLLNPDTPAGVGGKLMQVCDIIANGFGYYSGEMNIDISQAVSLIGGQVPLSIVGTNYQEGGAISLQLIADNVVKWSLEGQSLNAWESKQWSVSVEKI